MTEAKQIMKRCQIGTRNYEEANNLHAACYGIIGKLLAQQSQRPRVVFPTMLRKMWSGGEVQQWLDENVNKENT